MGVGAHGWVVDTAGHVNGSFSRARLQGHLHGTSGIPGTPRLSL